MKNNVRFAIGALHFGVMLNESESKRIIDTAKNKGVVFIDTGPLYGNGNSERIVGNCIKSERENYYISTKVGLQKIERPNGSFGVDVIDLTPDNIRKSLESSLKNIKTDYIDLFQLHAFCDSVPLEDTFGALTDLVAEGKIKEIGVSNYSPSELVKSLSTIEKNDFTKISCIETHYNMLERMNENELIPLCEASNVKVIPYRALGRGLLTNKYLNGIPSSSRAASSWRVKRYLNSEFLTLLRSINDLAIGVNQTLTSVSLQWLLKKDVVSDVLIGARDIETLVECISASFTDMSQELEDEIDKMISDHGMMPWVNSNPEVYFEK
jgi:aryl-alcohol dehydrogenase-like predicted oxidoreductase